MAPRTAQEVLDSMSATIEQTDATATLSYGPVFDLTVAPAAPEIAVGSQEVDGVRRLTTYDLDKETTDKELAMVGGQFGLPPPQGKASTVQQTFFSNVKPTRDIPVNLGNLVGNTDQSRLYVVVERADMKASSADSYYNAERRRYEVTATVRATAIGPDYDLPAFRIRNLVTPIPGIDGTENRSAATGGLLRQSNANYLTRIRDKMSGLNPEAGGGIRSTIREHSPDDINDIMLVYPKDRDVFLRYVRGPAIDAYVSGTVPKSVKQVYTAIGGESSIALTSLPVLSVTEVMVNGTVVNASFLPDTLPPLRGSARALDRVVLTAPLSASDVVEVTYLYDDLVTTLQADLFGTEPRQFGTDILVRKAEEVRITVELNVKVFSSFNPPRVEEEVRNTIQEYMETGEFQTDLLPNTLREKIQAGVGGVSSVQIVKFTRVSGGVQNVESIRLKKHQISLMNDATLVVRVGQ